MTFTNEGEKPVRVFYQIDYTIGDKHPDDVGRLHVLFRRENPTTRKKDFELLPERKSKGRFIGSVIGIRNLHPKQWWGEGEVKVYMDGDTDFPTICGTGSEDYVGLAWGIQQTPFFYNGCSLKQNNFISMYRWSEDRARTWIETVPITGDWQSLRDGIEVRFNQHDWEKGYTVHFSLRGQLVTAIEKIEGEVVTLRNAPTRTVGAATLRHCDDAALQAAFDRAVKEKRNLHVPVGRYRLARGLNVRNATAIAIEGANPVDTILDISEGEGACIALSKGIDVTVRNFTMVGHSGFAERDQCGHLRTRGSSYFWGFGAKGCNAVTVRSTERVLIENCHGRRITAGHHRRQPVRQLRIVGRGSLRPFRSHPLSVRQYDHHGQSFRHDGDRRQVDPSHGD